MPWTNEIRQTDGKIVCHRTHFTKYDSTSILHRGYLTFSLTFICVQGAAHSLPWTSYR